MFITMDESYIGGTGSTADEALDDAVRHWVWSSDTPEQRAEYRASLAVHQATRGLVTAVNHLGGDPEDWSETGLEWRQNEQGVFYLTEKMEM